MREALFPVWGIPKEASRLRRPPWPDSFYKTRGERLQIVPGIPATRARTRKNSLPSSSRGWGGRVASAFLSHWERPAHHSGGITRKIRRCHGASPFGRPKTVRSGRTIFPVQDRFSQSLDLAHSLCYKRLCVLAGVAQWQSS